MSEKWYNSKIAERIGIGFICLGIGSCCYLTNTPKFSSQKTPQVQEMKVDGHDLKFYILDKQMAVTEIDKEPILEFVKKH